jgi:hypothetical protein
MLTRTALIGLLAAAAAAILPAAASAAVTSSLVIAQGNGATAGSTTPTTLKVTFTNNRTTPKAMQVTFPPGFLLDLGQNEGKCLASSAPSPSCGLGYIKYSYANGESSQAALYLVTPPTVGDVAGLALDNGKNTETAPVTLLTSPADELKVEFPPFPTQNEEKVDNQGTVEAEIQLSNPRMPTACGAPLFFDLSASTFDNTTSSTSAPLSVSCSTLPYAPKIAATVTRVPHAEEGSDVAITLTQPNPSGESATSGFEFGNPKGVKTNKVLAPCFKGATCTVGTVAANSPTLDSSELSTGELTLAGSITSGNLSAQINGAVTMSFPPPFQFSVNGPINTNEHTITFLSLPDFPLGSITYTFLGVPEGPAFVSNCEVPSTISATLTPQDGGPSVNITGPVTYVNCPAPTPKPTASGSLSGLNAGRPKLHIHASHGKAANLKSLSIELPEGLGFSRKALAAKHVVHGLSLSGASIKSARVANGKLVLTFAHPAASVSLTARGPLLREGTTLEHRAKLHEPGELIANLRFTDAGGHASNVSLSLN